MELEENELISPGNKLQLQEETSECVCLCFVSSNARCKAALVEAGGVAALVEAGGVDGMGSDPSVLTCKHLLQNTYQKVGKINKN